MIAQIRTWYAGRAKREQLLIAAMVALALPLIAWLLIVQPMSNWYGDALEEHLEAVDRHGRVVALAEAIEKQPARSGANREVELQLVVTEAAGLAGVTLDEVSPSGPDSVAVTIANSTAAAAGEWLRSLEARELAVAELSMSPNQEGGVSVSARLARR